MGTGGEVGRFCCLAPDMLAPQINRSIFFFTILISTTICSGIMRRSVSMFALLYFENHFPKFRFWKLYELLWLFLWGSKEKWDLNATLVQKSIKTRGEASRKAKICYLLHAQCQKKNDNGKRCMSKQQAKARLQLQAWNVHHRMNKRSRIAE